MPAQQRSLADRERRDRGNLRRLLEVRGLVGGFRAPHRDVRLMAEDGTRLVATWLPGPTRDAPAVVLAHGFAANRRKPAYALLADVLASHVHVLTLDLRGHGASGGACTLGDREALDVDAAVRAARAAGHGRVAAVGLSMGGTSVLRAVAQSTPADAVVAVSTPAELGAIETDAMAGLDDLWRTPWKRVGFRLLSGVRLVGPDRWEPFDHPRVLAGRVHVPFLVVHGEDDHFFPISHAEKLHASAAGPATLWREPPGFGHAEEGIVPGFAGALGRAIVAAVEVGRFPERADVH